MGPPSWFHHAARFLRCVDHCVDAAADDDARPLDRRLGQLLVRLADELVLHGTRCGSESDRTSGGEGQAHDAGIF